MFCSVICTHQHFVAFQWKIPVHNLKGWLSVCPRLGNWFMRDFQNMVSGLCMCPYNFIANWIIARLRVDHKYLVPLISLDTKLECLIPTTTGAGVCTTSLVDFLVCTHNDFMGKCRVRGYE